MDATTWPLSATSEASILSADWYVFTEVGLAVAFLVWGLIVFAMIRWRRRDDRIPVQTRNNVPLEIAWTALPLVLVAALFVYTYRAEARVDAVSSHPDVTIAVRAYRWGWTFAYADGPIVGGAAGAPRADGAGLEPAPQLVLPLGETTRIELSSDDVTHGFWVPDFLFKRDAIPGMRNAFDLQPTRLGTYPGRCSQFCGFQHALMAFTVRVVTPRAFAAWRSDPVPQ